MDAAHVCLAAWDLVRAIKVYVRYMCQSHQEYFIDGLSHLKLLFMEYGIFNLFVDRHCEQPK